MHFYYLLLGLLAVWRITHLLQAEDGPWDLVIHLRRRAGDGFWGQLLDCFYCLSVWIAVPFAIYLRQTLDEQILLWLALSAGAILLERATHRERDQAPALFIEEESEEDYGMLRQEEDTSEADGSGTSSVQT